MDGITQLFIILLVAGLTFVGAEVFVPGGVLGLFGGVALGVAVILGFVAFGAAVGSYVAVGIVILLGVALLLWIRIFPRTRLGKKMAVLPDLRDFKATAAHLGELLHREGVASSDLRPGGFADIDGRRVDVITQGEMISRGTRVRVIKIESNRVLVETIEG